MPLHSGQTPCFTTSLYRDMFFPVISFDSFLKKLRSKRGSTPSYIPVFGNPSMKLLAFTGIVAENWEDP